MDGIDTNLFKILTAKDEMELKKKMMKNAIKTCGVGKRRYFSIRIFILLLLSQSIKFDV